MFDTEIFEKCEKHAKENYDGHFTLLRFTSDWGFCFGTLMDVNPYTTAFMAHGTTPSEAMQKALEEDVNAYEIEDPEDELFLAPSEPTEKAKPITVEKTSRNEPCPCGSGKKYKKCCL